MTIFGIHLISLGIGVVIGVVFHIGITRVVEEVCGGAIGLGFRVMRWFFTGRF